MTAVAPLPCRLALAPQDQTLLEQLVQQQFWLFGADIRRSTGNLLLELGFARYRAPDPTQGSSCYAAPKTDAEAVHLWGFGCCLTSADEERIFLSRHRARARRMPATVTLECLHSVPKLHSLCRSELDDRLPLQQAALLRWFGSYERMALAQTGLAEREATLAQLAHRQVCPAAEIAARWDALAEAIVTASL